MSPLSVRFHCLAPRIVPTKLADCFVRGIINLIVLLQVNCLAPGIVPTKFSAALVESPELERQQVGGAAMLLCFN